MRSDAIDRDEMMFALDQKRYFANGLSCGGDGRNPSLDAEIAALEAELACDLVSEAIDVERQHSQCSAAARSTARDQKRWDSAVALGDGHAHHADEGATSIWKSYCFESAPSEALQDIASDSLLSELQQNSRVRDRQGHAVQYGAVRQQLCAIAIELNRRALDQPQLAPRFRPERRPPYDCVTPEQIALSRDRQVIDLHWLWCTGHRTIPDSRDYVGLLDGDEFDFQLASKFACEKWTLARKAECLRLDAQREWQLAAIQTREFQKKWDRIWKQRPVMERRFFDSLTERRASRGHVEEWLQLWTVYRMVGNSPERIRQLLPYVSGQPAKDPSGLSKRLKRMFQRI
ncbi:hypothetical protein CBA19CS91_15650 [Paraburkholderia hospita]|nr:hypothetical protein CBA19CS91_15650 [Paraburkholderia hospita]